MKKLQSEADRLFSLLVRQDAANSEGIVQCDTCGNFMEWRKSQCGHFMSRRHNSTRFDRLNVAPQCVKCNIFSQGEQMQFAEYIDNLHGEGTAKSLLQKSKMQCKRSDIDYQWLIEEFKKELKEKNYVTR